MATVQCVIGGVDDCRESDKVQHCHRLVTWDTSLILLWLTCIPSMKSLVEIEQSSFLESPIKGGSGRCSLFHTKRCIFFPLLYLDGAQHLEERRRLTFKSTNGSAFSSLSLGQRDAVNAHNHRNMDWFG